MSRLSYPIKPWFVEYIVNDNFQVDVATIQVLKHMWGPNKHGIMFKIVGDGEYSMRAHFSKDSYQNLSDTERACWERSLIKINQWQIRFVHYDSTNFSDYVIDITDFDVLNCEIGFSPRHELKMCISNRRVQQKMQEHWQKRSSQNSSSQESFSEPNSDDSLSILSFMLKQIEAESSSVEETSVYNHGFLKDTMMSELKERIAIAYRAEFEITLDESKILNEVPGWCNYSEPDEYIELQVNISSLLPDQNNSKIAVLQTTSTREDIKPCIPTLEQATSNQIDTSIEVVTDNKPDFESLQETTSQVDPSVIEELKPDNNFEHPAMVCCPNKPTPSNINDIVEERRLFQLTLPEGEMAEQSNILDKILVPNELFSNLVNSEDTLSPAKVTSTETNDGDATQSPSSSLFNLSDLCKTVIKINSNCDSSQELINKITNKSEPVGSSALKSCDSSPLKCNLSVSNHKADSNLLARQSFNFDDIEFNPNEIVTSTAIEANTTETGNTFHTSSRANKRLYSEFQADSVNMSDLSEPAMDVSSPKRIHIESQQNTDETKYNALMQLSSLIKRPNKTAHQNLVCNWSLPDNILSKMNTYWFD
ncbi:serine/threonine-protein kinase DDB_G0283821-like [Argonauta hians]